MTNVFQIVEIMYEDQAVQVLTSTSDRPPVDM